MVSAFEEREDGEPGTPHPGTCPCRVGGTPGTRGGQADTALSTPARHAQAGGCGARVALGGQPVLEAHAENGLCEQDSGWPETRKGQHRREEAQGSQRGSTRLPRPSTRSGSMGQSRGGGRTRKQGTGWAHTSPRPQPPPGAANPRAHYGCRCGPPSRPGRCRRRSPHCPRRYPRSHRGWAGSCCSWLQRSQRRRAEREGRALT